MSDPPPPSIMYTSSTPLGYDGGDVNTLMVDTIKVLATKKSEVRILNFRG